MSEEKMGKQDKTLEIHIESKERRGWGLDDYW